MTKLKLSSIRIQNFKGTADEYIQFTDRTTISGPNRSGKTTIFDAYLWCLYGRDSSGRTQFGIRKVGTADDVAVSVSLTINGSPKTLLRRMSLGRTGREENSYEIDKIPTPAREYSQFIASLVPEKLGRALSSPNAFFDLTWQDQRAAILSVIRIPDKNLVLDSLKEKGAAYNVLSEIPFDEYERTFVQSGKIMLESTKQISELEGRIREASLSIVDGLEDLNQNEAQLDELIEKQAELRKKITAIKSDEYKAKVLDQLTFQAKRITDYKDQIEFENREKKAKLAKDYDEISKNLVDKDIEMSERTIELVEIEKAIETLETEIFNLEIEHKTTYSSYYEKTKVCQECGRGMHTKKLVDEYNARKLEEFNRMKSETLLKLKSQMDEKGKKIRDLTSERERTIHEQDKAREVLSFLEMGKDSCYERMIQFDPEKETALEIKTEPALLEFNREYKKLADEFNQLRDNSEAEIQKLAAEGDQLQTLILECTKKLSQQKDSAQAEKRVEELTEQRRTLIQSIATAEQKKDSIIQFRVAEGKMLEKLADEAFYPLRMNLFSSTAGGRESEGLTVYMASVPYPDLNYASKVNAGLVIIASLGKLTGITVPVFIDNRESVTEIRSMPDHQIINLTVRAGVGLSVN